MSPVAKKGDVWGEQDDDDDSMKYWKGRDRKFEWTRHGWAGWHVPHKKTFPFKIRIVVFSDIVSGGREKGGGGGHHQCDQIWQI